MAYLKGGTVVDGNLYIEGVLKAKNISGETDSKLYTYVNFFQNEAVEKNAIMVFDGDSSNAKLRQSIISEIIDSSVNQYNCLKISNTKNLYIDDLDVKNFYFKKVSTIQAFDENETQLAESIDYPSGRVEYWAYD